MQKEIRLNLGSLDRNDYYLAVFYDNNFFSLKKHAKNNSIFTSKIFFQSLPYSLDELSTILNLVLDNKPEANLSDILPPPNPFPSKIVGIGKNFKEHAKEMKNGNKPAFFLKAPSALIGHNNEIIIPSFVKKPDYEGEVVLLMGKKVKNASIKEAKEAIIGYTAGNDVTGRDLQYGEKNECLPWSQAKGLDTFAPTGPYIKIIDDYSELENVCLKTYLNGIEVQHGCPNDMIFDYANIIVEASRLMTLYPGDMVFTGTPAGVGHAKGNYLKNNDLIKIEVTGIDPLINKVVRLS
ncbi:MAG: fumarylacetoacetate hydrolase family protein [Caldisphaera sp.]